MPCLRGKSLVAFLALCTSLQGQADQRPCDIYFDAGTPCVAAHSTVRALFASYSGKLYTVQRSSDNATLDIGVSRSGGLADASAQDAFCSSSLCVIVRLFDQSERGNHLGIAPGGPFYAHKQCKGVVADSHSLLVNGSKVYGAWFEAGMGYRNDTAAGIAKGDEAETIYMLTSAIHYNDHCCFDYGNAEINVRDDGVGTMEAVNFGTSSFLGSRGQGQGPWVTADLENGLWGSASRVSPENFSLNHTFVSAVLKGFSGNRFAVKGGDAGGGPRGGGPLQTMYDGVRPSRYSPMQKQGALILGIGGDNSHQGTGVFYEGAVTAGCATNDSVDEQVHANIIAAGYGN